MKIKTGMVMVMLALLLIACGDSGKDTTVGQKLDTVIAGADKFVKGSKKVAEVVSELGEDEDVDETCNALKELLDAEKEISKPGGFTRYNKAFAEYNKLSDGHGTYHDMLAKCGLNEV